MWTIFRGTYRLSFWTLMQRQHQREDMVKDCQDLEATAMHVQEWLAV